MKSNPDNPYPSSYAKAAPAVSAARIADPNKMQRLQNWWEFGDQESPCILATIEPDRPSLPQDRDLSGYWTDIDGVMAREMARIEQTHWLGEAVPFHYIDLGASAMPCALGARVEFIDSETIWAHPVFVDIEEALRCRLDPHQPFYQTIIELTRRSTQKAPGHHFVAPFALGGVLDNLIGLCGAETTLTSLLDHKKRIKPVLKHLQRLWIDAFAEIQSLLSASHPGEGIGWAGIWAPGTTFPLQEDCSYMLSPDCFDEFCLPVLGDLVDFLDYPLYHLDGNRALAHLPSLLRLNRLKAIQWQPGAGRESIAQWTELIRTILAHRKSVQIFARPEEIDDLVQAVGSRGILISCTNITEQEAIKLAERFPQSFCA
ncbi:MAG TPA: hypothetical protein PKW76_11265 [bacterium]|nr:hypothetical protein [bacterium]HPG46251.1 hypothetical protein [bacterium]HPM98555.1 hypothetical protein [bacterium]